MFKITCLVVDKNLPKVLHSLTGLVVNLETPRVVGNAKLAKGKVMQLANGNLRDRVAAHLPKHASNTITSEELKQLALKAGGNQNSVNYVTQELKRAKLLRLKSKGVWLITLPKKK